MERTQRQRGVGYGHWTAAQSPSETRAPGELMSVSESRVLQAERDYIRRVPVPYSGSSTASAETLLENMCVQILSGVIFYVVHIGHGQMCAKVCTTSAKVRLCVMYGVKPASQNFAQLRALWFFSLSLDEES
jgi:hypothetical protein